MRKEKKGKASLSRKRLRALLIISCSQQQRACERAGFGLDATESSANGAQV